MKLSYRNVPSKQLRAEEQRKNALICLNHTQHTQCYVMLVEVPLYKHLKYTFHTVTLQNSSSIHSCGHLLHTGIYMMKTMSIVISDKSIASLPNVYLAADYRLCWNSNGFQAATSYFNISSN